MKKCSCVLKSVFSFLLFFIFRIICLDEILYDGGLHHVLLLVKIVAMYY